MEVCVCGSVCVCRPLLYSSKSGRGRAALVRSLARRPLVARAQLGPGDGHLLQAGGTHLRGEVDDAAVVLHVLELVLLGGLHVDHRVLVHLFL